MTIVSEPLVGSGGPLGVLSLAFVAQPEPERARSAVPLHAGRASPPRRSSGRRCSSTSGRRCATPEAGRERLSLLSEVTRLLSSSLEPTTVIRRTMSLVEGRLADSCSVQVPGESGLVRLDVREPRARGARASPCRHERRGRPPLRLRCAGRRRLPHAAARNWPRSTAVRTETDPQGTATALAVPLTANGEVIGVMTFVDGPGRLFEADDVSLATEVASRAGVALSNATRFQREHVVADVLQRAVLPDSLPDVDGPPARRRVPRRSSRHLRRRRLVRRLRARRRPRLLQRGRRHGQGCAGRGLDGPGAQRDPRLRGLRPVADRGALVARPPLRHADRGPGGHSGRRNDLTVDRPGRPEQRRSPAATRGARRRQRDLLPDAALAAHRGRAERCAPAPGRAGARTAGTRSSCTRTA